MRNLTAENHPTHQKVKQVLELMEALGLSFELLHGDCFVFDGEQELRLVDDDDAPVTELPLPATWSLVSE